MRLRPTSIKSHGLACLAQRGTILKIGYDSEVLGSHISDPNALLWGIVKIHLSDFKCILFIQDLKLQSPLHFMGHMLSLPAEICQEPVMLYSTS